MISPTLRRRSNVVNAPAFKNYTSRLHCGEKNEYGLVNQLSDHTNSSVSQPRPCDEPAPNKESIDLNCSDLLRHIRPVDCGSSYFSETWWTNLLKLVSKIEGGICLLGSNPSDMTRHDSLLVVDLLDRFLSQSLHSGSKIHSLGLSCCLDKSVSQLFEQSLYSLGRLGVEKLVLNCDCGRFINPDAIDISSQVLFEMPSLKYLELGCCCLMPSLRSQCSSLQSLVLTNVTLLPGALECILSYCLSLHALRIVGCECMSKLTIRGPNLQLKYLDICRCDHVKELELHASNLVVFEFTTCLKVNFIFDHVPKLQTVYLSMDGKYNMRYVCGKLAEDVPHLKSFSFISTVGCFQDSSIWTAMNSFSNLRRLDVTLDPAAGRNDLLLLTPLLQRCPLLEEFHLHLFLSEYNRPPQREKQGIVFPSELKKVEISGFLGTENDIEFALCILKSAIKLEEMHITKHVLSVWSDEKHNTIVKRLRGQAVSRTARLVIELNAQDYKPTRPIEEEFFYYVQSN